ncbi:MAG: hypothetical protein EBS66_18665 [Betaproteobacteria bacterium]|nr:hypothetical protein [Betaproteobacteria bacterium]
MKYPSASLECLEPLALAFLQAGLVASFTAHSGGRNEPPRHRRNDAPFAQPTAHRNHHPKVHHWHVVRHVPNFVRLCTRHPLPTN